jgi:hypothetical protein
VCVRQEEWGSTWINDSLLFVCGCHGDIVLMFFIAS